MIKQYTKAQIRLAELRNNEDGAGLVEYGLLVAGIALIAIVGVTAFGGDVRDFFDGLGDEIDL